MMKKFLTTTLTILSMATIASAQTETAGKLNITANVGYVYNFANDWGGGDVVGKANGGLGYGGRIGWTNGSGLGLSADYLGFASKWKNDFEITNNYHVVTFTPSYRISFGAAKEWGLKLGLGVGFSLADVSWIGNKASANSFGSRVAGGASYTPVVNGVSLKTGCGAGTDGTRYYSDSVGGGGIRSLGANQCENAAQNAVAAGLLDSEIAGEFNVDTGTSKGKLNIGLASTTGIAVSYGVWRRLFTAAPTSGAFFLVDNALGQVFNVYETRANYVTRVSEASAAAVETDYTAAAAAACVTSKGMGALVVNGSCRSTAEQATDLAAERTACTSTMTFGIAHTYAAGVCSAPGQVALDAKCVSTNSAGYTYTNGVCTAPVLTQAQLDAACVSANAAGWTSVSGVCKAPPLTQAQLDAACVTDNGNVAGWTSVGGGCQAPTQVFLDAACAAGPKGVGATSVGGVCKSTADRAADLAALEALTACINEKGAGSTIVGGQCTEAPAVASKAKDDAGFVIAPEIALEYDNGLFHANISARYIYELFNVKYDGQNGAADQLQKSGPLAVFIGAGIGVNF